MDRKILLIVDDDEDLIALVVRWICTHAAETFEPLVAVDGYEALEFMRTKPLAAVILDIQMRNLDGVSVVQRARTDSKMKEIPIIISSGCLDEERKSVLGALGVRHFIDKPYRMEHLFELVQQVLSNGARS